MTLQNQWLFETPFPLLRDNDASLYTNLKDEHELLFETPLASREIEFEAAMPSCEPGKFKSGKLNVVRWGGRVRGNIPKDLKLAILSRGRIRLPIENVKWLIDANRNENDWVNRLPSNLRQLLPEVDVTIELFTTRTNLSPTEANAAFLQYLVGRHQQHLQNCHKLFLSNWRAAFFKDQLEGLLKINLNRLFQEAKVPLPKNMRETDKGIFVLLVYVSFPNQLEQHLNPLKPAKLTRSEQMRQLVLRLSKARDEIEASDPDNVRKIRVTCIIRKIIFAIADGEAIDDTFKRFPSSSNPHINAKFIDELIIHYLSKDDKAFRFGVIKLYSELLEPMLYFNKRLQILALETVHDPRRVLFPSQECENARYFLEKARDKRSIYHCLRGWILKTFEFCG